MRQKAKRLKLNKRDKHFDQNVKTDKQLIKLKLEN